MRLWAHSLMKCSRMRWNRSRNKNLTSNLSGFCVNQAYSSAWMSASRPLVRQQVLAAAAQKSPAFWHLKAKGCNCVEVMGQLSEKLPTRSAGILERFQYSQASSQADV